MPDIGPHLLGRKKQEERDPRDLRMETVFHVEAAKFDPNMTIQQAYDAGLFSTARKFWAFINRLWRWINSDHPQPPPVPSTAVMWHDPHVLDQGNTNHCVGFGWTDYLDTGDVDDHDKAEHDLLADYAHSLYYAIKVLEGEPGAEDGAYTPSGAKVLKERGEIATYVSTTSLDTIRQWVLTKGPVVVGTDWTDGMFQPTGDGFVVPSGPVVGGHCYLLVGYDPSTAVFTFLNSWGSGWGVNGTFRMHVKDWWTLFGMGGDAIAATEVPVSTLREHA